MRQSETYRPSNAQLRFLLTWTFADVEEAAASHAAFALLKVNSAFQHQLFFSSDVA